MYINIKMSNSSSVLKEKIDEFIKKFYLNKLLQGFLLSFGILIAFFIVSAVLEYFGQFSSSVRTFIFVTYVITAAIVVVKNIFLPLLKWMRLGKTINYEQASGIIGDYFPEIKDKLLNTIQLQNQAEGSENELLAASINQRIKTLSPIKFTNAVNIPKSIKKYGRYALVPLVCLFLLLVFQSNIITKPADRLMRFNKEFPKEMPFQFVLKNPSLTIIKNSDLTLKLRTEGKTLPNEVFVKINNHLIKMEKTARNSFEYKLPNISVSQDIAFTDGEFYSDVFKIKVLPNPSLLSFKANLKYPAYINKQTETIQNIGDFTVPKGTVIEWVFNTKDAESLQLGVNGNLLPIEKNINAFKTSFKAKVVSNYFVSLINSNVEKKDSVKYSINIIEDRHPSIFVERKIDSLNPYLFYFYGKADDDYGINQLKFTYKKGGLNQSFPVKIGKTTDEIFYYAIDLRTLEMEDNKAECYFEVWDNDGVNGNKSTKSQTFAVDIPTEKELRADADKSSNSIKSKVKETMKELLEIQKKSQELNKEMMESKSMDWQQQKKIKDFLNEQKQLQVKIEDLKKEQNLKNEKEKQLNKEDKELLEKQKQIEKLFNELMTPEMKELLKKMEDLLKQQNKEQLQKEMEKLKQNNEEISKQLDRTLEQFKQLEIEKKINEQLNQLNKLAEEQKELSKKTEEKSENQEQLKKEQEDIKKKFEDIQKELKNIDTKNKELETPMKIDDSKKEQESINQDMNESSESLDKKQNKKASQKQKEAGEKMQEMADKLKKSVEDSKEEQEEEDYYTLRQILENLVEISTQQEDLMMQIKEISGYSPKFVELSQKQRKLKNDAKMIEDSLLSLAKRQLHIKSFVTKEISNINYQMNKGLSHLANIEIGPAAASQQYVMTGLNNLSVMLAESLKKMQDDMNEKKSKKQNKGQCNKPGKKGKPGEGKGKSGNKPKMDGMKKMQDAMNKQLKDMQQQKEQGINPSSQQFAKIAAQQEALRREISRLEKMLKEEGKNGSLGDIDKTKELMEQQEKDLVNKKLTPETMRRSKEIETRMLEHEKAEREQEQDNKREAEQAKPIENKIPPSIKEYLEKKAQEIEVLRKIPLELSPFYKEQVRIYFDKVGG